MAAAPVLDPVQPARAAGLEAQAEAQGEVRSIIATAYCLDGRMANGEPTHEGAAAMRGVPLGATVTILDGPYAGRAFVVKDRTPKRGVLDIWMDDCRAARDHGAHEVTIEVRVGAAPAQVAAHAPLQAAAQVVPGSRPGARVQGASYGDPVTAIQTSYRPQRGL